MFEYLLATSDYATESDIFREGIKSLYREKTEPDNVKDWDNRIQECARITADNVLERMQTMLDATVRKGGLVAVAGAVTDADEPEETDVGMAPPEAVEELSEEEKAEELMSRHIENQKKKVLEALESEKE